MRPCPVAIAALTAAAVVAGPATARGQTPAGVPYGQYVGRGCGEGILSETPPPDVTYTRGTLVCVVGTFTFAYLAGSGPLFPDQFRLVANTVQTLNPAFAGSQVYSNGAQLFGRYEAPTCPGGVCSGLLEPSAPLQPLLPGDNERAVTLLGQRRVDLSRATFDSVRFVYDYALPGAGPGFTASAVITFSAVPEPSTLALAALGGAAVGAGAAARRRRRGGVA